MSISLKVSETLEWTVMIHHKQAVIPQSYPSEKKFTSFESLKQILESLTVTPQCIGNNEELFIEFCQYRKKELRDKSGSFLFNMVMIIFQHKFMILIYCLISFH